MSDNGNGVRHSRDTDRRHREALPEGRPPHPSNQILAALWDAVENRMRTVAEETVRTTEVDPAGMSPEEVAAAIRLELKAYSESPAVRAMAEEAARRIAADVAQATCAEICAREEAVTLARADEAARATADHVACARVGEVVSSVQDLIQTELAGLASLLKAKPDEDIQRRIQDAALIMEQRLQKQMFELMKAQAEAMAMSGPLQQLAERIATLEGAFLDLVEKMGMADKPSRRSR